MFLEGSSWHSLLCKLIYCQYGGSNMKSIGQIFSLVASNYVRWQLDNAYEDSLEKRSGAAQMWKKRLTGIPFWLLWGLRLLPSSVGSPDQRLADVINSFHICRHSILVNTTIHFWSMPRWLRSLGFCFRLPGMQFCQFKMKQFQNSVAHLCHLGIHRLSWCLQGPSILIVFFSMLFLWQFF